MQLIQPKTDMMMTPYVTLCLELDPFICSIINNLQQKMAPSVGQATSSIFMF